MHATRQEHLEASRAWQLTGANFSLIFYYYELG